MATRRWSLVLGTARRTSSTTVGQWPGFKSMKMWALSVQVSYKPGQQDHSPGWITWLLLQFHRAKEFSSLTERVLSCRFSLQFKGFYLINAHHSSYLTDFFGGRKSFEWSFHQLWILNNSCSFFRPLCLQRWPQQPMSGLCRFQPEDLHLLGCAVGENGID